MQRTKLATVFWSILACLFVYLLFAAPQEVEANFTTINWTTVALHPNFKTEAAGETVNGKLYVFGGYAGTERCCFTPVVSARAYDPVTNTWTQLRNMPRGATHHGMTTDGTDIYYAGGYIAPDPGDPSSPGQIFGTREVWRYNVATDTYTSLPLLPVARAAGQLAYLNGRLHYIGGTNQARTVDVNNHYVLDLANLAAGWVDLSLTAPLPNGRHHMGVAVLNGEIYIVGGQHGHDGLLVPQSDVHAYNPVTNTWRQVASLPFGINHNASSTFTMDGRIIVLGGQTAHDNPIANTQAYDPVTNSWVAMTPMPGARYSGVGGVINGILYYTTGGARTTYRGAPLLTASITISKTPDTSTINSGASVTFTITVTNNGSVALTGVTVTDPNTPACNLSIGNMVAGATQTYTCTAINVTQTFTNTASVSGNPPTGNAVTASDSAQVNVTPPAPAITIVKDADQTIPSGGTATFTITVTNTGNVPLTGVNVTDANASNCARNIGNLAAGDTNTYTCTLANVIQSFTNSATVTGNPPTGNAVTASDTAQVTVTPPAPAITIAKDADQTIPSGGTATFTITVTNTGNVPLTGVNVTDGNAPNCARNIGNLAAGGTNTYTCTLANVIQSFTNSAAVTGNPPTGNAVTASDTAQVTVTPPPAPAITIVKDFDQTIISGSTASFTITVTNTGNVPLTGVAVIDANAPDCARTIGNLVAGGTNTYTCTLANVTQSITNTATVTGNPPTGNAVTASDTAQVTVTAAPSPAISIVKDADQTIQSGGTATFTITVTNTGNVLLTGVTVTDADTPDCARTLGDIPAGAAQTYICTLTNVTQTFTNVANVTGNPPIGNAVTGSDSATVTVTTVSMPGISIVKDADQTITSGGTATFTITVRNIGNVALTGVTVSDALVPDCVRTFATLPAGTDEMYSCSLTNVTQSFTNNATVTGNPPTGNAVTATDSAMVTVQTSQAQNNTQPMSNNSTVASINPQFVAGDPFITKIAEPPFALPGENVTFIFTISNPGTIAAPNVVATDPIPAEVEVLSATAPSGTVTISGQTVTFQKDVLQPGESVTVTILTRVHNNVATPFTIVNRACVRGVNQNEQCATASVLSISSLPTTGETPLLIMLFRGLAIIGIAAIASVYWLRKRFER